MPVEVILPRVDMDMTSGKIGKWFKNEGDSVREGEPLLEIETDKATMEIESPASGVLRGVSAKAGEEYPIGRVIGWIYAAEEPLGSANTGEAAAAAQHLSVSAPLVASEGPRPPSADVVREATRVRATPLARRTARDGGVDIAMVRGTGPRGRVQASDVAKTLAAASASLQVRREEPVSEAGAVGASVWPAIPVVDFAKYGLVEVVPLSRIKRVSGSRVHASWVNVPHVTHCDEADITDLEAFRKKLDDEAKSTGPSSYRVSLLPFLMKACAATLKAFPIFNSALSLGKDTLVMRWYWHIAVAVDTPDGLVVPVIRDVDQKGCLELARELGALSAKARQGKLTPGEMQGATFTISSLGGIGGTAFTPIVNSPEVAILGVVRSRIKPVWDGEAFRPRLILPFCLSYDHRVIDGAAAARFCRSLGQSLEDVRRILL